jgi:hypothetical protein
MSAPSAKGLRGVVTGASGSAQALTDYAATHPLTSQNTYVFVHRTRLTSASLLEA